MKKRNVSILSGGGGSLLSGGCEAPAPVRVSETGRARNWTMPPLRLERERKERTNSATIDNRCVEFDRRESTESTAIIGLRALGRRIAFTMAEILLSLTIIGVVAAITLPSLTGNINERTWNTQRKALYARMSQAIPLMGSINGYSSAETFVTAGLSKVLKINNICNNDHLQDCGIASKFVKLNASTMTTPTTMAELNSRMVSVSTYDAASNPLNYSQADTDAAAFETANGESILAFYNPNCRPDLNENAMFYFQSKLCANFVYDLNGSKGPNTVGKDIGFISVFYPSDSVIAAPYPAFRDLPSQYSHYDAGGACTEYDPEYRIANREEMASLFVNMFLIQDGNESLWDSLYWTSSLISSSKAWYFQFEAGYANNAQPRSLPMSVLCIKR